MDLWEAVGLGEKPCVLACVGAGGKTSLLQSLAVCARSRGLPTLLTTTTKMYYYQVSDWKPIFSESYVRGFEQLAHHLTVHQTVSWFTACADDKVVGLPTDWIEHLYDNGLFTHVLVEADGAREKLLKAPNGYEPQIPLCTTITVGVMNIQVIGRSLVEENVHRLPLVLELLQKKAGQRIEMHDLVLLATHSQGIFQYNQGKKMLLLTGADSERIEMGRQMVEALRGAGVNIERCILTQGFGAAMIPVEVFE